MQIHNNLSTHLIFLSIYDSPTQFTSRLSENHIATRQSCHRCSAVRSKYIILTLLQESMDPTNTLWQFKEYLQTRSLHFLVWQLPTITEKLFAYFKRSDVFENYLRQLNLAVIHVIVATFHLVFEMKNFLLWFAFTLSTVKIHEGRDEHSKESSQFAWIRRKLLPAPQSQSIH